MKLSETNNVFTVRVTVRDGVESKELMLGNLANTHRISLDQTTAKEFLPVLQHFINTGEMLK